MKSAASSRPDGGEKLAGPVYLDTSAVVKLYLLSSHLPLRTLDALHLALATQAGAVSIVTSDRQLGAAAVSLGLLLG